MKKWQAYLDKGTPDNPNTEDLCYADSLLELLTNLKKAINLEQFEELQKSVCTLVVWYGELAD